MREYPRLLAAVEGSERSKWPIVEALLDEIETTKGGSARNGEYERASAYLTANGYPSYKANRIKDFYLTGQWIESEGLALRFKGYPFERVIEARKKARSDHENALVILAETKSKRQIRPDRITKRQIVQAVKGMTDEEVERIEEAVSEEAVKRTVYADRPKPKHEDATRRQAAKRAGRLKANPSQAADSFVAMLGPVRARIRAVCQGYQDFIALVEDEEWRDYAREHLVAFQTDVNLALGEVLEGSIDDALARLLAGEEVK